MLFSFGEKPAVAIYASRRKSLVQAIKDTNKDASLSGGKVLLIGGFEHDTATFTQESSFYYFTGINEPGLVLLVDLNNGHSTVYIPHYKESRAKWTGSLLEPSVEYAAQVGVNKVELLGQEVSGYTVGPFFDASVYSFLIAQLEQEKQSIYTLMPTDMHSYVEQRLVIKRLQEMAPSALQSVVDISGLVADLRSSKDMGEVELMKGAINITIVAHEAAAQTIRHDIPEMEVQASVEGVMTMAGARRAFPSIIASGKSGTVLHYMENSKNMKSGDLVIVDIGASYCHYAADLTRTYPVSGTFTKRQREVYDIVLAAQEYIAEIAKPGLYLSNKDKPDQSLNHKAKKFFADRGYGDYFTHSIGHYLGLDTHDVGDYTRPLREGDMITIEPGLYIPEENIGIRIEDDYWIIKNGAICLSEELPKTADDIESFMQESSSDDEEVIFDDECEESEDDMSFDFHDGCDTEH